MKNKKWIILIVSLFIVSFVIIILGSIFKLHHWPYSGTFLTIGMIGNVLALLIGMIYAIKLIIKSKDQPQQFL